MSGEIKGGVFAVADVDAQSIATGVLTVEQAFTVVSSESSTSDNLDTLALNGSLALGTYRPIIILQAASGHTITIRHGQDNIFLNGAANFDLTDAKMLALFYDGTNAYDIGITGAGGGGGAPTDATYITQTANGTLSAEQALAALSTGLMVVANGTGVITSVAAPSGAVVGTSDTQTLSGKTLTTPTIGDLSNATHNHSNAAGGGTLAAAAIASGTLAHERGGLEADVSAYDGFPHIASGSTTNIKTNLSASTAPDADNDTTEGYVVGSLWIDTTNDNVYQCVDNTDGAAVWRHLNAAGGGSAGLVAIADATLGSAAASISFTSIPGTYAHLMFVGRLRSDRASNDSDGFTIVFNSDTTATNYRYMSSRIAHNGAAAADLNNSNGNIAALIAIPAATSDSGYFASVEMKIMNYSTTGFMRHVQGYTQNNSAAATHRAGFHGGLWINTANAITQIDIAPLAGSNFIAGSRLTLYGMVDA